MHSAHKINTPQMLNCWPRKKTLQLSIHSTFVARSLTLNWGSKASRHRYPVWNVGPCMSVCYTCCIFTKSTTLSWQSHRHGAAYDASTRLVVASLEERSWVVRETSSPELIFHHIPEAFEFFFFQGSIQQLLIKDDPRAAEEQCEDDDPDVSNTHSATHRCLQ